MTGEIAFDKIVDFYDKDDIKYLFACEIEIIKKELKLCNFIKEQLLDNASILLSTQYQDKFKSILDYYIMVYKGI